MPRKIPESEAIHDLDLLIDLSCLVEDSMQLFDEFHRSILEILYDATDVVIDYAKSSIYMNMPAEFCKGDFLQNFDEQVPARMSVNVEYTSLATFLKGSINETGLRPEVDFYELYNNFAKGRKELLNSQYETEIDFNGTKKPKR